MAVVRGRDVHAQVGPAHVDVGVVGAAAGLGDLDRTLGHGKRAAVRRRGGLPVPVDQLDVYRSRAELAALRDLEARPRSRRARWCARCGVILGDLGAPGGAGDEEVSRLLPKHAVDLAAQLVSDREVGGS
jgi:hypothetical protein